MRQHPDSRSARVRRALLLGALPLFALAALWLVPPAARAAAEPGDLWEDRMQVEMSGLPAGLGERTQVHQRCSPRTAQTPPLADDSGHCEVTDLQQNASGMRWKMRCQGTPPMSGSGEIRYEGRDAYRGRWTMDVGGQSMAMKMEGRRVGECDAAAARQRIDAAKAQAAAAQQQVKDIHELQCKSAVDNLMSRALGPDQPHHCEPALKQRFCQRLQTVEGFKLVGARAHVESPYGSGDLDEGAAFCGLDAQKIAANICQAAEQQEALDVLSNGCVGRGYGQALVMRECAGRDFSSPPAPKYAHFCFEVASQQRVRHLGSATAEGGPEPARGAKPAPQPQPATTAPTQAAIDKGKQLLKGLFGR